MVISDSSNKGFSPSRGFTPAVRHEQTEAQAKASQSAAERLVDQISELRALGPKLDANASQANLERLRYLSNELHMSGHVKQAGVARNMLIARQMGASPHKPPFKSWREMIDAWII